MDPIYKEGWLFPGNRVSFNNSPFINLSMMSNICNYSSPSKTENGMILDKRRAHYITFNNDASLKWYYQDEKELLKDKEIIKQLIINQKIGISI